MDGELAKLQGKWKLVSREDAEEGSPEPNDPEEVIVIHSDVLEYAIAGEVLTRQKMTIHPNTSPVQVDLVYVDEEGKPQTTRKVRKGKDKNKNKVHKTVMKNKGIYILEGDKLRISISRDDKKWPADFTPAPDSSLLSLVKVTRGKQEPKEDRTRTEARDQEGKAAKDKDR